MTATIPPLLLLALAITHAPRLTAEEPATARIEAALTLALREVDLGDGVDADEALLLASAYFGSAISGCGGVGSVVDENGVWVGDSLVGLGAQPGPRVVVSRDGALVRAEGHPTVRLGGGTAVVVESGAAAPGRGPGGKPDRP